MIKIDNVEVYGFESAIRGMRNPMNSWDKSDSHLCAGGRKDDKCCKCPKFNGVMCTNNNLESFMVIGENDFELMKKLVKAGSDHSKFMRMINVTFDITAPLYWWSEYDTYKVGTVRNSCSKMHKIHEKEHNGKRGCGAKRFSGAHPLRRAFHIQSGWLFFLSDFKRRFAPR